MSRFQFSRKTWSYFGVASAGIVAGIIFWGGFNTAMEATNSMEFCTSCHEMRDTVFQEYKKSIHYSNPAGVRAICSDCHVPKDWTHKIVRKVQASGELWGKLTGSIDTPEKFEAKRLDLAKHEWARMKASDSRECRNCHSFEAMDFAHQKQKAAEQMQKAMKEGQTCIDCHKGIAHKLPDMTGTFRTLHASLVEASNKLSPKAGETIFTLEMTNLSFDKPAGPIGPEAGRILGGTAMKVLGRDGDFIQVRISGWQQQNVPRLLYAAQGKRIFSVMFGASFTDRVQHGRSMDDPDTGQTWVEGTVDVWTANKNLVASEAKLWEYGEEVYLASCAACHSPPQKDHYAANEWIGVLTDMKRNLSLDEEQYRFLQKYLQLHAKDTAKGG